MSWQVAILRRCCFAATMLGCSTREDKPTATTEPIRHDSATVEIVEYGPEPPAGIGHWRLDSQPMLDIGADDQSEYELTNVSNSRWTATGIITQVSDLGTMSELRKFDSTGRFLWRYGRLGDGPGEFRNVDWISDLTGDTLVFWDSQRLSLSVVDPHGKLVRTKALEQFAGGVIGIVGHEPDGSLVLRRKLTKQLEANTASGYFRETEAVLRLRSSGTIDTIATWPGAGQFRIGWRYLNGSHPLNDLAVAVRDSVLVHGDGERFEIEIYSPIGTLRRIIRWSRPRERPTDSIINVATAVFEDRHRDLVPPYEAWLRTMSYFAHRRVLIDDAGNIWVEDESPPLAQRSVPTNRPHWTVFDSKGKMLAILDPNLPNFLAADYRSDRIMGVWADSNGIQHIRVHRIVKERTPQ